MTRKISLLIFLVGFLSGCSSYFSQSTQIPDINLVQSGVLYATGLTDEQKVSLAIDRKKEIRTIRKGDYMTLKNNPENAIAYYLKALERLPNDVIIHKKLAHAYFLTKNWKNAYDEYAKVPLTELKEEEYRELFQALFFDDARPDRLSELGKYTLDTESKAYYRIVDMCYAGIHDCIISLQAYSGSSQKIQDLKKSIQQAGQVSPDYQYRNFLVATVFYQQEMYRVVDVLTEEILEKQPAYTEVQKLRGFALSDLGKYPGARDMLLSYIEKQPKDTDSLIRLGEIYTELKDYATANLYFNNVVTSNYSEKTQIERRLAFNYAALQDYKGMLQVLGYLLQEKDVTEDDYVIALGLALQEGENDRAYEWAYAAIQKFSNSPVLISYYMRTLRMSTDPSRVVSYFNTLSPDIQKIPLVQLEYAIALADMKAYDQAQPVLQSLVDTDPGSDWGIEAGNYLKQIQSIPPTTTN